MKNLLCVNKAIQRPPRSQTQKLINKSINIPTRKPCMSVLCVRVRLYRARFRVPQRKVSEFYARPSLFDLNNKNIQISFNWLRNTTPFSYNGSCKTCMVMNVQFTFYLSNLKFNDWTCLLLNSWNSFLTGVSGYPGLCIIINDATSLGFSFKCKKLLEQWLHLSKMWAVYWLQK